MKLLKYTGPPIITTTITITIITTTSHDIFTKMCHSVYSILCLFALPLSDHHMLIVSCIIDHPLYVVPVCVHVCTCTCIIHDNRHDNTHFRIRMS